MVKRETEREEGRKGGRERKSRGKREESNRKDNNVHIRKHSVTVIPALTLSVRKLPRGTEKQEETEAECKEQPQLLLF
jgi:hypothetical protein